MSTMEKETSVAELRQEQIDHYWAGDLSEGYICCAANEKRYLKIAGGLRSLARAAIRIALVSSRSKDSWGWGWRSFRFFPIAKVCSASIVIRPLRDVPGKLISFKSIQMRGIDLIELAREAVEQGVSTLLDWNKGCRRREKSRIYSLSGRVHLVEYENLEMEFLKHMPFAMPARRLQSRKDQESGQSERADDQESRDR